MLTRKRFLLKGNIQGDLTMKQKHKAKLDRNKISEIRRRCRSTFKKGENAEFRDRMVSSGISQSYD